MKNNTADIQVSDLPAWLSSLSSTYHAWTSRSWGCILPKVISCIEVYSKARVDLLNMYWDLMKVPLLRKKLLEDFRTLETMQKSVNKFGILCSWCLWRKHGFVCHCQIYQKWFWEKDVDNPLKYFAESESDGKLLKHKSGSGSENPKSSQFSLFLGSFSK